MDQTVKTVVVESTENPSVPIDKLSIVSPGKGDAGIAASAVSSSIVKTEDVVIEIAKVKSKEESKFDPEVEKSEDNDGSVLTELSGITSPPLHLLKWSIVVTTAIVLQAAPHS